MRIPFSSKQARLAAACAFALAVMSGAVSAQQLAPADERQLWTDTSTQVWMNGYGECWHSAFGPPPAANVCSPQPVAQYVAPNAPAPYVAPVAPLALVAAPQPAPEKLTFEANVLFDFDKSELRPAGRDTLDGFIGRIQGVEPGTITAVGYADRFGTDGYNQALSERRVAAVKDYLISKGVAATWVQSSGAGENRPTTAAGECAGAKSASTIACLQPDRHVFVEVAGSRLKQ